MKYKITFYDTDGDEKSHTVNDYENIDALLEDYGVTTDRETVKEHIEAGLTVVYDEEGDKTFDPQFHSKYDMRFTVEEVLT